MKLVRTVTIDGKDSHEYELIKAHIETILGRHEGWEAKYEPLIHRVTAYKSETVTELT